MKPLEGFLSDLRQREIMLWLDGDRLRYRAPEGSLSPADLVELRDRKAEIVKFLQTAKQLSTTDQIPLQPVSREGTLPLSFAQQRFWFFYQFEPDSPANNLPVVVRFTGNLRLDVLERSIAEVVRRHEVLRSRFPMVDGQPVLVIDSICEVELPIVDLQGTPDDQRDVEAHRVATKDARQPFDLEKGPLLRVTLFRLTEQEHLLLWNMPCIICDGTSSDLFYRELTTCYVAYATGKPLDLPELPIQYADFAHWQRQYLQGEVLESHLSYWKQQLSDSLSFLQLPTDYPRPSSLRTCQGDRYARMLSKSLHHDLLNLGQQLGTTLFVVLLTAFNVLLYRYSQQDDILTTFVSSGRNRVETENLIGFFSNTLILQTQLDRDLTFRELVQRIHRQNLDAYTHQELPFERLVDALSPEQRQGRSPLFQTKFTLNPPWTNGQGMSPVVLPDLEIKSLFGYIYHGKTKYDLTLVTREQDQGLGAVIDYNAELFVESTMERMMGHFQTILESVVVNPNQVISTMPMLTTEEQQLLETWSRTEQDLFTILTGTEFWDSLQQSERTIEPLIASTQTYVLDRYLQPVPIGVAGELYVGGVENQSKPDRSDLATHFIPNPFSHDSAARLYKTGKIVRRLPHGNLELVNGSDSLATLERNSNFSMPLVASRDGIEHELTEIWQSLLGVETIGIRDNFFNLGGHSLLAVRLFAQIEATFGEQLPLSVMLKAPTIEQLAVVLRQEAGAVSWSPLVEIQTGGSKPPLFCIHGGGFNVLIYRDLAINLGSEQPVYGLQARGLQEGEKIVDRLEELATDYIQEIRRVQPRGPYFLSGLSNGGNIALEMAQQLQAQGEDIALLAMFDTYGPGGIRMLPTVPRFLSSLNYLVRYSLPRFLAKALQLGKLPTLVGALEFLRQKQRGSNRLPEASVQTALQQPDNFVGQPAIQSLEDWMNWVSQFILEHSPWSFFLPKAQLQNIEGSLSERLKKLEEIYEKVHHSYVPKAYSGKIMLFQAEECPPGYRRDLYLGWQELALDGVEVYKIPGHHTSLMASPVLAVKMKTCLETIQSKGKVEMQKRSSLEQSQVSKG